MRSTFLDHFLSIYGPIRGSKRPKLTKMFWFRVWNMGCPIERWHFGDHFWYPERLVNSAVSWSYRADRPSSDCLFSHLPFQIPSFAQGRKNWAHGASVTNFFDRQGFPASHTQTLKNEEPSRAPPENALAFYKLSFFVLI